VAIAWTRCVEARVFLTSAVPAWTAWTLIGPGDFAF
jgi:hypothetical protein